MERRKRPPSDYYCIICGRNTNDKKYFVDEWGNYFYTCSNCKKVWCTNCMGQITGLGVKKAFRLAKKGKMTCISCNNFLPVVKLPQNLPFVQKNSHSNTSQTSGNLKETEFCSLCGHEVNKTAKFCEICGGEQ